MLTYLRIQYNNLATIDITCVCFQSRILDALSVFLEESLNGEVNMAASATETKKRKMKSRCYGDDMIKSMSQLRENDELCDFTVSAEGQSFKVIYFAKPNKNACTS